METPDIISHATTALGASATMGAIAKFMIQNWIKKQEDRAVKTAEALQAHGDKTAEAMEGVRIELAKMSVKLETLQRTAEATAEYGKIIAVLQTRFEEYNRHLNNLGQKVRDLNGM